MAKKTVKSRSKRTATANSEVETLQSLGQASLAWALGVSTRTLRDKPDIPRRRDGRYDLREVIQHLQEHLVPPPLPPEAEETLLRLAGEIVEPPIGIGHTLPSCHTYQRIPLFAGPARERVNDLRREHGDGVLLRLWELIESEAAERYGDIDAELPAEDQYVDEQVTAAEARAREIHQAMRADQGEYEIVCEGCRRVRRGSEWVKKTIPRGVRTFADDCPSCREKA